MTQRRLKELLSYNKLTGIFVWITGDKGYVKVGDAAGYRNKLGYFSIRIDRHLYQSHRLAFLYVAGYIPENNVDHIDRDPSNNAWSNLRDVSQLCNIRNASNRKDNTSGIKGVCFSVDRNKWCSYITNFGKTIPLGRHKDFNDAVLARWEAEVKYNFPNCNSSSSAYNYLKDHNLLDSSSSTD